MTKYNYSYGWDVILWNSDRQMHEYWEYDNDAREHVYSHDVPEELWDVIEPELGNFEYLVIAEF